MKDNRKQTNKFYEILTNVRTWYRANFQNYPYWRVTYPNGERTILLYRSKARNLQEVFGGKIWIDFEQNK